MKNYIIKLALAVVILPTAGLFAEMKVAYIHMEKVFQGYYKTQQDNKIFETQRDKTAAAVQKMKERIDAMRGQYQASYEQASSIALNDDARNAAKQKCKALEGAIRESLQKLEKQVKTEEKVLAKEYLKMRNNIVKELREYMQKYGESNGYEMIFDISGLTRNHLPAVIYYPKNKEITDDILGKLNRGHEHELIKKEDKKKSK